MLSGSIIIIIVAAIADHLAGCPIDREFERPFIPSDGHDQGSAC
jgi:hypothetical protein